MFVCPCSSCYLYGLFLFGVFDFFKMCWNCDLLDFYFYGVQTLFLFKIWIKWQIRRVYERGHTGLFSPAIC